MKYVSLITVILLLISCSESKKLLRSLNTYQVPLNYMHDSELIECDKFPTVTLNVFENEVFHKKTSVSKINRKVLPFIIYHYQEVNLAVKLGQNSLEQDYADFFKKSFITESQRTGCYTIGNSAKESLYTIEVTFDTCEVNSQYQRNNTVLFYLLAYSMNSQEIGQSANSHIVANVELMREGEVLFEKKYAIEKTFPFIYGQSGNIHKLHSYFITNMAESLSYGTKDCIEQIIKDVNEVIWKQ